MLATAAAAAAAAAAGVAPALIAASAAALAIAPAAAAAAAVRCAPGLQVLGEHVPLFKFNCLARVLGLLLRRLQLRKVLPGDVDLDAALDGSDAGVLLDHVDREHALRARWHGRQADCLVPCSDHRQ